METLNIALALIAGLLVRVGLPALITASIVWWLRRVDARWQAEAEAENARALTLALAQVRPCWEVRGCPAETREKCPAYANPGQPCWQLFRDRNGQLREACLECKVFRTAPVPAVARAH